MIDLHLHTKHSDGFKTVSEVLTECEQAGLLAISITDHDSIDAYVELKNPEVRKLFSGKILHGVELSAIYKGVIIHILGYGINLDTINKEKFFTIEDLLKFQKESLTGKFASFGVNARVTGDNSYAMIDSLIEISKENIDKLPTINFSLIEGRSVQSSFFWKNMANVESAFYIDYSQVFQHPLEAIKTIRDSGGKAILAHPYAYGKDSEMVLESFIGEVDGVECYHTQINKQQSEYLIDLCKQRNLIITGGSDYHGEGTSFINSQNVPDHLLNQFDCGKFV